MSLYQVPPPPIETVMEDCIEDLSIPLDLIQEWAVFLSDKKQQAADEYHESCADVSTPPMLTPAPTVSDHDCRHDLADDFQPSLDETFSFDWPADSYFLPFVWW